jgi:hypothetical protein
VRIYNTFKTFAMKISLPLHKLSAIATVGAPGMLCSINGFIALCKKDESFPDVISYHCITHQEALCVKILPFGYVRNVVKNN